MAAPLDIENSLPGKQPVVRERTPSNVHDEELTVHDRRLVRKIDRHILPGVILLYLMSFLDRSNVANARIEGLVDTLRISGDQYLTGLTLFFIGYVIFEIPFNIVLRRTTPRFWLPTLTFAWGVVATLHGVTFNRASFYAARFFLGALESGLFPGVVYYLTMWYRRTERTFRVALFFSAASLAGAFGGILAWGIAHMKGIAGLGGWQWIFILEGLLTVVIAWAAYFFITSYPSTAKWLTSDEKQAITARLHNTGNEPEDEVFSWTGVLEAFKDLKCWLYAFTFHSLSLPLYTLSLFLPSIIKSLGYTAASAQLLTIPPYALATILTVMVAFASEKLRVRAPFIMSSALIAIIGYIILITNKEPTKHPRQSYAGVFLAAAGIYPATALGLSWPALNVSGKTKRATTTAMQISIGNLGAVIGTQLYRVEDAPRYVVGHSVALAYMCCNILIAGFIWFYLSRLNKRKAALIADDKIYEEAMQGDWKGDADIRWRFIT